MINSKRAYIVIYNIVPSYIAVHLCAIIMPAKKLKPGFRLKDLHD